MPAEADRSMTAEFPCDTATCENVIELVIPTSDSGVLTVVLCTNCAKSYNVTLTVADTA